MLHDTPVGFLRNAPWATSEGKKAPSNGRVFASRRRPFDPCLHYIREPYRRLVGAIANSTRDIIRCDEAGASSLVRRYLARRLGALTRPGGSFTYMGTELPQENHFPATATKKKFADRPKSMPPRPEYWAARQRPPSAKETRSSERNPGELFSLATVSPSDMCRAGSDGGRIKFRESWECAYDRRVDPHDKVAAARRDAQISSWYQRHGARARRIARCGLWRPSLCGPPLIPSREMPRA